MDFEIWRFVVSHGKFCHLSLVVFQASVFLLHSIPIHSECNLMYTPIFFLENHTIWQSMHLIILFGRHKRCTNKGKQVERKSLKIYFKFIVRSGIGKHDSLVKWRADIIKAMRKMIDRRRALLAAFCPCIAA